MNIMTAAGLRQSFLDFFRSQQHTIVPSASLLPDSPNLLFTNAGMNQFVPIFLGRQPCPYQPGRATDTQKCIRAGGKHNDLEDVGLDTYHHTFFEMLGNWSFGDYFKQEAIAWAWELLTQVWKFPPARLYATVYSPHQAKNDPAEFDQEAWDIWAGLFQKAGLDPKIHIVNGNKKENFWMMGDTGPCGPCSEIHMDLTPGGDTKGSLVNKGSAECIEIWNLVFIQFNANADGTFVPLPARHVDTGMGFERASGVLQCTRGFTDFTRVISNYESDVFRPIFDEIQRLSGRRYTSTLPAPDTAGATEQEQSDVAFRVIADHIRTLAFAIADGILPGNTDRNYVLRRILRRAVRYGRTLGFHQPFFYQLVDVLAAGMGDVFPEIRAKQEQVQQVIRTEEEAFNRTLDRGIEMFNEEVEVLVRGAHAMKGSTGAPPVMARALAGNAEAAGGAPASLGGARASSPLRPASSRTADNAPGARYWKRRLPHYERPHAVYHVSFATQARRPLSEASRMIVLNALRHFDSIRYRLLAACVMPDHVHLLFQPQIKAEDPQGQPIFWGLGELLHSIKSFTANQINQAEQQAGALWEPEYHDRLMRSDADIEEKFHYICSNPWTSGVVGPDQDYEWMWYPGREQDRQKDASGKIPDAAGWKPALPEEKTAPRISGDFAFKLYDTYGFPLDLTELMARERGLTVDTAGFEKLMAEQKARARAAQKKEIIEVSQVEVSVETKFIGYDQLETPVKVQDVLNLKGRTAVILDATACYAEMGGQVGDQGELAGHGQLWRITDTQKAGNAWLHFLETGSAGFQPAASGILPGASSADKMSADAAKMAALPQDEPVLPVPGDVLTLTVDLERRRAIQRHHTATHLLHWALHQVVSPDAVQKGSYVGPEKLTFDFSSAALTPAQLVAVERAVNTRILDNAPVSWQEKPYVEIQSHKEIRQFFGEKYGESVRVVQIGGRPGGLDGWSMELCGGTHVRATGDIGQLRIVAESSVAAGIRRIEAVCGLAAWDYARREHELLHTVAQRLSIKPEDVPDRIAALQDTAKKLEKELKQKAAESALGRTDELIARAQDVAGVPVIAADAGEMDADALRGLHGGIRAKRPDDLIVLGSAAGGKAFFIASAGVALVQRGVHCGKLIGEVAKLAGGGGGGRPDNAQAGGKDPAKVPAAIAQVPTLLAGLLKK